MSMNLKGYFIEVYPENTWADQLLEDTIYYAATGQYRHATKVHNHKAELVQKFTKRLVYSFYITTIYEAVTPKNVYEKERTQMKPKQCSMTIVVQIGLNSPPLKYTMIYYPVAAYISRRHFA